MQPRIYVGVNRISSSRDCFLEWSFEFDAPERSLNIQDVNNYCENYSFIIAEEFMRRFYPILSRFSVFGLMRSKRIDTNTFTKIELFRKNQLGVIAF